MMVPASAALRVERVPLQRISVLGGNACDDAHILLLADLLRKDPRQDLGPVYTVENASGLLELWDGHHRFCAYVIAGREDMLAVIQSAP